MWGSYRLLVRWLRVVSGGWHPFPPINGSFHVFQGENLLFLSKIKLLSFGFPCEEQCRVRMNFLLELVF
ncbi:hypothetical protein A2U01_0083961, partial [Trifolium medium]|nr:hypothetical protein [Trifolium medium]